MPHTPAQKKELRKLRKAEGRCHLCPQPAIPGQVRCTNCATAHATKRQSMMAASLCPSCVGRPCVPGKSRCSDCLTSARDSAARSRSARAEQGKCRQCDLPPRAGGTACAAHAAASVASAKAATLRLRARTPEEIQADRARLHPDGLKNCRQRGAHDGPLPLNCFGVNTDRPDGLQQSCRDCRGLAYRRHAMAYWRAQGIPFACVYCGGAYEHVDHVIPTSRGGTHDVTNLVPACTSCNTSKGDKLLDEWLALRGVV